MVRRLQPEPQAAAAHAMLPDKVALLIVALLYCGACYPLSKPELTCLTLSTYRESKQDWLKAVLVAINRQKQYRYYWAKTRDICAIVKSKQYTSAKILKHRVSDTKSLKAIFATLSHAKLPITRATHFKTRKGVMIYEKKAIKSSKKGAKHAV